MPFDPEKVTADRFVEWVGADPSAYASYIFVVDGITLGIRDREGVARVNYLNAPEQTRKLAQLPGSNQSPRLDASVTQQEILRMLEAEGGKKFRAHEVRLTPSGLSGSLNGGLLVSVGGDPENGATWEYDLVFGPDGRLAFYMKTNVE